MDRAGEVLHRHRAIPQSLAGEIGPSVPFADDDPTEAGAEPRPETFPIRAKIDGCRT
jgi:hypothetical protein